jgi:hypothetical protein
VQIVNSTRRAFSPAVSVLLSSAAAAAALGLALWLTRPGTHEGFAPELAVRITPERAAEGFIEAYLVEDFARAASFATDTFARVVTARSKQTISAAHGRVARTWLLQESHVLRADKLRFVGVLVEAGQDESAGWPVTLTLVRRDTRFWVDELHWPKGPPSEHP